MAVAAVLHAGLAGCAVSGLNPLRDCISQQGPLKWRDGRPQPIASGARGKRRAACPSRSSSNAIDANTAKTPIRNCDNPLSELEEGAMSEPKLEVPAELRDLAEKTIEQAEKAFGMFFDAANKSIASVPSPGTEMSKQALSLTEQNIKAAFEHARKLVHATDLQQAMQIQSEFLKSQFTNAGEHMRQIAGGVMSAAKDATKEKF